MPSQALAHTPAALPQPRRLSDRDLVIRRDVYEALPLFYRCLVDILVEREEWHIIEPGAV